MDQLRRMATFAAVVRAGSFSGAARSLGVTKAAVSKHVSRLEDHLGVRLLHRTTRRLALTEIGRAYHEHCARMVAAAQDAADVVRDHDAVPRGVLRISAPTGIGQSLIAPTLAAFASQQPRIRIELILDDAIVDMVEQNIDVAIRAAKLADSSLTVRKIAPLELLLVAAPNYLAARGIPHTPDDLVAHDWVGYTPLGDPQRLRLRREGKRRTLRLASRLSTNDGAVLRSWIVGGEGIGLLPTFFVRDVLTAGALRVVLSEHAVDSGAIYAVHAHGTKPPPKIRRFIDHLVATV